MPAHSSSPQTGKPVNQFRQRLLILLFIVLAFLLFARSRTTVTPTVAAVPTETSPPTSTGTSTPTATNTPQPLPSATSTIQSTPTNRPPTQTPSPTPSQTPSPPPTPTVTPTATQNIATPTPDPYTVAPIITGPRAGINVVQNRRILLEWFWNGTLAADEFFDIKLRPDGQPASRYVAWEAADAHEFFAPLPPGRYFWSVQVLRGYITNDGTRVFESFVGPESQPQLIIVLAQP